MNRYTALSGLVLSLSRRFGVLLAVATLTACSSGGGGSSHSDGSSDNNAPAAASCHGVPLDCENQEPGACTNGCNLVLGIGSMPDSCSGSPESCDQLGDPALCAQAGCEWGTPENDVDAGVDVDSSGTCQGTPPACSSLGSEDSCWGLTGCTWTETCAGTVMPCSVNEDNFACNAVIGCSWNIYSPSPACEGTPFGCSLLPATSCYFGGCGIAGSCTGTPDPCSAAGDEMSCAETLGCSWQ
jgi:hypothetical protein